MTTVENLLHGQSLLGGFKRDQLERLAACGSEVEFAPGQRIVEEGSPAEHFWLVQRGTVALQIRVLARGPVTIETIGPDDILGWSWLVEPYRWHFDAEAVEPTTAIEFDSACVRGLCDADPQFGYDLLQRFTALIVDRLQATRVRLLNLYGNDNAPRA